MKFKNIWLVAELLGALGLVQHYKKNTEEWARIQIAMVWLKSISFARDLAIYQVGICGCLLVLVMSAMLMEGALIFFLPVSLQAKVITAFVAGGINFAVALSCLGYFLSSERWLRQAAKYNVCVSEQVRKESAL